MRAERWWSETRLAARRLVRSPLYGLGSIAVLGVGIGASAALFSVAHTVLASPLPYPEPDRLVRLSMDRPGATVTTWSEAEVVTVAERTETLAGVVAYDADASVGLETPSGPLQVSGGRASASLLPTLGVPMVHGRFWSRDEDRPGAPPVAVLSESLWRSVFGGDVAVLGRAIDLDGVPHTVVGVAPASLRTLFPGVELWMPLGLDRASPNVNSGQYLRAIARLDEAAEPTTAGADLDRIAGALTDEALTRYEGSRVTIRPLADDLAAAVRTELGALSVAVLMVLLTACFNLAGFTLTRGEVRREELAVRLALGAGRADILGTRLSELALLAAAGTFVGALLAVAGVRLANGLGPAVLPRASEIGLNPVALALASLAGIVTLVLSGTWQSTTGAGDAMRGSPRGGTGPGGGGLRRGIVVAQLAASTALLTGAGALLESVAELRRIDLGFETEELTTFKVSLPPTRYPDYASVRTFSSDLLDGLGAVPGVRSAAAASRPPLADGASTGFAWTAPTSVDGVYPTQVAMRWVTADYFTTMGVELVEGRAFRPEDPADSVQTTVLSRSLAEALWPGESAIGRRWKLGRLVNQSTAWRTVVGVVEDIRDSGPAAGAMAMAYFPQTQLGSGREMTVVVAASTPVAALGDEARRIVSALDPAQPIHDVSTMTRLLERRTALNRIGSRLLGAFAALAILLAAIGLYGLVGFTVAQRTRELGVRAAVGATRDRLVRMVVGESTALAMPGIALGALGGVGLTRLLQSLVVEVAPFDPSTLLGAAVVIALVVVTASLIPAWATVPEEPASALRG